MFQALNEGVVNQDLVEGDTILCLKCGDLSMIFLWWAIKTNQSITKH